MSSKGKRRPWFKFVWKGNLAVYQEKDKHRSIEEIIRKPYVYPVQVHQRGSGSLFNEQQTAARTRNELRQPRLALQKWKLLMVIQKAA